MTTEATADNDGEKKFTCTDCGATKTEVVLQEGHEHTIAETWSNDDTNHWYAASCGKEKHNKDKAAHTWDEGEVTTEATADDDGEKIVTCTVCGKTKTETILATDHEHTIATTWTTDDDEYHWHKASCGKEEHNADKAAHEWEEEITREATCRNDGTKKFTCKVCGKTKTETIPKIEHIWNEGYISKKPSTIAAGERKYTCTVCKTTRTGEEPKHEHTYAEEWESDDTYHWHEFTCDHKDVEGEYGSNCAKALHSWDWEITKQPAYSETEGSIVFTCTECKLTKPETLPVYTIIIPFEGETTSLDGTIVDNCVLTSNYYIKNNLKCIVIEHGFTEIPDGLFYNGTHYVSKDEIETIILPNTITSIGKEAFRFYGSALKTITIPNSVTSIGDYAFANCYSLEEMMIPSSVTSIGKYIFSNNGKLENIIWAAPEFDGRSYGVDALKKITFLGSVTSIGKYAFNQSKNLTSMTFFDENNWYCNGKEFDTRTAWTTTKTKKEYFEGNDFREYGLTKKTE